jgi:hypothetical protein
MRLYEIEDIELNPGEKTEIHSAGEGYDKYVPIIKKYCSESLQAMKQAGKPLLRGFTDEMRDAFVGVPRNNRITFTNKQIVQFFNEQFAEAGIIANRSNAISTTTTKGGAKGFGELYYLFPVNGFKFSWSPAIFDFGHEFAGMKVDEVIELFKQTGAKSIVDWLEFTDKDFVAALKSGNEISIYGRYVAIKILEPYYHGYLMPKLGIK